MSLKPFSRNNALRILLAVIAFAATIAAVIGGAHVQEGYDIEVGSVSPMRFFAPTHMVNPYRTNVNREAAGFAAENMVPVMERDISVQSRVLAEVEAFFAIGVDARLEYREAVDRYFEAVESIAADQLEQLAAQDEPFRIEDLDIVYRWPNNLQQPPQRRDLTDDSDDESGDVALPVSPDPLDVQLPIHLNNNLRRLFVEMSDDLFETMQAEIISVIQGILYDGVHMLDIASLVNIQTAIQARGLPDDVTRLAFEIISNYIEPNIFVNEVETELRRLHIAGDFEMVYYQQGELIVDANAIITEEAFMALEQLNLIRTDDEANMALIAGSVLLVCIIYGMALAYLYIFFKSSFSSNKEALLMFTLYAFIIGVTWLISGTSVVPYVFVPLPIFCMLLVMFFNVRIALATNISATVICAMIFQAPIDFVIYFTLMGINISMISNFTTTRSRIMFAGASTAALSALIYLGVSIFFARTLSQDMLVVSAYAAIAGLFAVIVSIGTAPIWEFVFGAVTSFRLIELSNPNHSVLRKLAIEAPGTYHHSLIVANLAESAAYEIGANPYLARAGGYYHDIGKIKYPLFFAENQGKENPHDKMQPHESCEVLVSHVEHGLELATRYRLPKMIKDIIEQHQGKTLMKYFYHKAKEAADSEGAEIDEADYRYNFTTPQSKEAALIMLADTVEAAVRSKIRNANSFAEIEEIIRRLIKDKIDDGQLIDSGFTLRDIESTIQSFFEVFRAMNHERIAYPTLAAKEAK